MIVTVRRIRREMVEEIEFSDTFDRRERTEPYPPRETLIERAKKLLEKQRPPLLLPHLR